MNIHVVFLKCTDRFNKYKTLFYVKNLHMLHKYIIELSFVTSSHSIEHLLKPFPETKPTISKSFLMLEIHLHSFDQEI